MTKAKRSTKVPRMWKCGDDFENPIPAGTGKDSDSKTSEKNHWQVVFDSYLEADSKQCESWKDEVNILLIFAGLFSAVVTAFLIESYKFLLPPDGPEPPKFGPDSPHVIRLNSLWFCSLVLSLTTVVIGIVALQWIRNHQRYHGIKPRDALSVYEMRTKALRAWHIRWAFLSLPLLILVALVLFFVGLVDFLLSLNKKVAAPVAVLVYATLALLFMTTILPSLQIFKLYFFTPKVKVDNDMPTPCPYKSPQSWIFHQFLIVMIHAPGYIMRTIRRRQKETELHVDDDKVSLQGMPLFFTLYTSPKKWTEYDTKWLRLRDMYSQTMEKNHQQSAPFAPIYMQHSRRPIYDEAQILKETITETVNPSADVLFAAYHCFREISKNALYQGVESTEDYAAPKSDERNLILRGYYWKHISQPRLGPPISALVRNPNVHLLHDENMLIFLQMHSSHNLPEEASRIISAHLSELEARILAYAYATGPTLRFLSPSGKTPSGLQWLNMMSQQYIDMINSTNALPKFKIWSQFAPNNLNGNEVSVSTGTIKKTIIQCSKILEHFVRCVPDLKSSDWQGTIYTHRNVAQFLRVPAAMLRYQGSTRKPFDVFSQFEDSFHFIQSVLCLPPPPQGTTNSQTTDSKTMDHKPADYLFLLACHFVEQLFSPYTQLPLQEFSPKQCKHIATFIKVLDAYEQANNSQARIEENWNSLWSDTDLPKEPGFKTRPESVNLSYIRWEYIPAWIKVDRLTAPPAGRPSNTPRIPYGLVCTETVPIRTS